MTGQSIEDLLSKLAALAPVRPPAQQAEVNSVEERLGIRLSADFVAAYTRSEPDRGAFNAIASAVVFADYSIESWHYAAHFSSTSVELAAPIYLLHLKPSFVAGSLRGFLAAALVDGPEIYPKDTTPA